MFRQQLIKQKNCTLNGFKKRTIFKFSDFILFFKNHINLTSINCRSCFSCFSKAWTRWLRSSVWDLWCCSVSRPFVSCSSISLSRALRRRDNELWSFSACRCKSSLSWAKRSVSASRARKENKEGQAKCFDANTCTQILISRQD